MNIEKGLGAEPKKEKTNEEVMNEFESFGMPKTADFKKVLAEKDYERARKWLEFIKNNREHFPQYNDSWFRDRYKEIEVAEENPNREWSPAQTVEEAKEFLEEKFGFSATSGFREALENDIEKAEEWLNYIINNSNDFPQYHATWDSWMKDRKSELKKAKSK